MNLEYGGDGVEIIVNKIILLGIKLLNCVLLPDGNQLVKLGFSLCYRWFRLMGERLKNDIRF